MLSIIAVNCVFSPDTRQSAMLAFNEETPAMSAFNSWRTDDVGGHGAGTKFEGTLL
jgi:hypothetical protein